MDKPKNLHHQSSVDPSSSFQTAVNSGKRVKRITSDSKAGRQMINTPGSILVQNELLIKFQVLKDKEQRPKHGGAKEIARRAKQLQKEIQYEQT